MSVRRLVFKALALMVALGLGAGTASAQPYFNIDFNAAFGTPTSAYGAAAGQPGVWQTLTGAAGPTTLNDISGAATAVTLTLSPAVGQFQFNNAGTLGDDQALMDDFLDIGGVGSSVTMTFANMTPGSYLVYSYAWAADSATFITSVNASGGPQLVGGAWPGSQQLGVTYALHSVDVLVDGLLTVSFTTDAGFGSVNGIQIAPVPEPTSMALCGVAIGLAAWKRRRSAKKVNN
jgi:hypothetical protein